MVARLAQTYAADLDLADLEFLSHQMVQRNSNRNDIAARFARCEFHAVVAQERLDSLRRDQGQLEIRERLEESPPPQSIAIALQADSRDRLCMIDGEHGLLGGGGYVDGLHRSSPHSLFSFTGRAGTPVPTSTV